MNYKELKEDVVSIVNAYLGIQIIEILKPKCIDLYVQPLTQSSLGLGGILANNGRCFSNTISLSVTESGFIILMLTDGVGLLKKILWSKEFRHLSELFLFIETYLENNIAEMCFGTMNMSV